MTSPFVQLAAWLQMQAEALAAAHAEDLQLARTDPGARWRKASLLWPRFTAQFTQG
jgi:hypothetical protein